jgi:hypothetical protein
MCWRPGMLPLAPFSAANPLLQAVSLGTLHLACLAAGVLALGVQAVRGWMVGGHPSLNAGALHRLGHLGLGLSRRG